MKHARREAAAVLSVVLGVMATGCSWPGMQPFGKAQQQQPAPAATEGEPAGAPADGQPQPDLAAIEEFLRKTEHYAQQADTPAPESVPASASEQGEPAVQALTGSSPEPAPPDATFPPADQDATLLSPDRQLANAGLELGPGLSPAPTQAIPVLEAVTIRVPNPPATATRSAESDTIANAPLQARPTVSRAVAQELLDRLEADAPADDFAAQWRLRLVQLAAGRPQEARQVPEALPVRERRLLQALVDVGMATQRAAQEPVQAADEALRRTEELHTLLVELADPAVAKVVFCRRVVSFGSYEEMEESEFVAGRTLHTIIYSEVRNLSAETTEDGRFRTLLSTRLEVLNAEGKSMWQHEEPKVEDICRGRRNDFFLAQRIALPPTLPPGPYTLKVLVEDRLSGRAHEAALPFTIGTLTPATGSQP